MAFDWNDFDLHTPELYTSRGYPWEAWDIQGLVHTHRQAGGPSPFVNRLVNARVNGELMND